MQLLGGGQVYRFGFTKTGELPKLDDAMTWVGYKQFGLSSVVDNALFVDFDMVLVNHELIPQDGVILVSKSTKLTGRVAKNVLEEGGRLNLRMSRFPQHDPVAHKNKSSSERMFNTYLAQDIIKEHGYPIQSTMFCHFSLTTVTSLFHKSKSKSPNKTKPLGYQGRLCVLKHWAAFGPSQAKKATHSNAIASQQAVRLSCRGITRVLRCQQDLFDVVGTQTTT
eukprot:4747951-Amphidinium_carterae.1